MSVWPCLLPQPSLGWWSGLLLLGSPIWVAFPVAGQLTPDATLGEEASVIRSRGGIEWIEGGAARGGALFHSFEAFNVAAGQAVYFANPAEIETILSRVTGFTPSQIDGLLGVDGAADLFLLNPQGILFGPDARLDVSGALVVSTSARITFAEGGDFRTTDPNAPPLVTVTIPLGLQLQQAAQAAIVNAADLQVGTDLTLIGQRISSPGALTAPQGTVTLRSTSGDVQVQQLTAAAATLLASQTLRLPDSQLTTTGDLHLGAGETVMLRDSAAAPLRLSAGGTLLIQGDRAIDLFALNHPQSGLLAGADLILRSAQPVAGDAHYWANGDFRIETLAGAPGDLLSPHDPIIRASGDVSFNSYSGGSLHILAGGSVTINGPIEITGPDQSALQETVILSDGTLLTIDGTAQGTLDIRAGVLGSDEPGVSGGGEFDPASPSLTASPSSADITVGGISVPFNGQVFLSNQVTPNLALEGGDIRVNGAIDASNGDVTIDARRTLQIAGDISSVGLESPSGDITLLAGAAVISGNILSLANFNDSGTIRIDSGGDVITGNVLSASPSGFGNSGDVLIRSRAGNITPTPGSAIASLAVAGNSGDVRLEAAGTVRFAGGTSGSLASEGGASGTVSVTAGAIALSNGATLTTRSVDGSGTGNLSLDTRDLSVTNATVEVSSPQGAAGVLRINSGSLTLDRGFLTTESGAAGLDSAGNLIISLTGNADLGNLLTLGNESLISATGLSADNTGANIDITADLIIASDPVGPEGSDIVASSAGPAGGITTATVDALVNIAVRPERTPLNDIVGNPAIVIETDLDPVADDLTIDNRFPRDDLPELPELVSEDLLDPALLRCATEEVTQAGRGGLPERPTDLFRAIAPRADWVQLPALGGGEPAPAAVILGGEDGRDRGACSG